MAQPDSLGVDQLITQLRTALTACTLPQPNWDACMHRAIHHCILVRHVTSQMQLDTPLSQVVVPPSMANPEETSEEVTFAEHDWREFKKLAPQQLITIVIMTVMHLKYVRGVTLCTLCHAPPSVYTFPKRKGASLSRIENAGVVLRIGHSTSPSTTTWDAPTSRAREVSPRPGI